MAAGFAVKRQFSISEYGQQILVCLAVLLFPAVLATQAQAAASCGSPPDPWGDASGYASWCSCMGGTYNWSTTACEGVTSGDTGQDDGGGDGTYDRPRGTGWYCLAKARDGSWGWGEHWTRARAESLAHDACRRYSKGLACRVTSCELGGGGKPSAGKRPQASPQRAAPQAGKQAAGCGVCFRKLKADINAGWASASLRTYVSQAIAGYNNCKRRMKESCDAGDRLAGEIQLGCLVSFGEAYKACVVRIMNKY